MNLKSLFNRKEVKVFIFSLIGTLLAIFLLEVGLNLWLRSALRNSLSQDLMADTKVETAINWLGLGDFLRGRVGWVKISGQNCQIGNLRYADLRIDNRGFTCNLRKLYQNKELEIITLNKTIVEASINETALQEYSNFLYPEAGLVFEMFPGNLRLSARPNVLGNKVLVRLEGKLNAVSQKSLRFYPERLIVAGRTVPRDFLQFIGNQIPLQFSIMERWPIRITKVQLNKGVMFISFREIG